MLQRLPLVIDGVDYSPAITRYGYTVGYEAREGPNGGMMQDGSMCVDILAWKAVLTLPCNDLRSEDQAALLTACMKPYISVTYWDTKTNAERKATFIPAVGSSNLAMIRGGIKWFSGMSITLTEA